MARSEGRDPGRRQDHGAHLHRRHRAARAAERQWRPHPDGRETVRAIALKLGNAIALPVLPFTPNHASADLPGTIGLTNELFAAILEHMTEEAITTGFKNVVLMGDHGGGQTAATAKWPRKLDAKYASQGKHVLFCDEVYAKANGDFDKWLTEKGYPASSHAGIPDTSDDALSRRRQAAGCARTQAEGRARRPGAAAGTRSPIRTRRAREQRHHRRRPPLDRRARQEALRHQGRLRREADTRASWPNRRRRRAQP